MQQQRLNQLTVYTVSYMYSCSVDALVGGIVGGRLQLHLIVPRRRKASKGEGGHAGQATGEGSDSDSATVPTPVSLSVAWEFPVPQCRVDRGAVAGSFYRLVWR